MDSSSTVQNRKSRRSQVYFNATLDTASGSLPVKLRNLSGEGALVESESLPIEGTDVVFTRKELSVGGRVVWVTGNQAGVAFNKALPPEQVLRHVPSPRPPVQPDYRRPGLNARDMTAEERKLVESWAWSQSPERPGE